MVLIIEVVAKAASVAVVVADSVEAGTDTEPLPSGVTSLELGCVVSAFGVFPIVMVVAVS